MGGVLAVGQWWRCHKVGASALVLEAEGPINQHEVKDEREEGGDNHVMGLGGGILFVFI